MLLRTVLLCALTLVTCRLRERTPKRMLRRVATVALSALVAGLLAASPATAGTASSGAATLEAVGGFVALDACQEGPPAYRLTVDEGQVDNYDDWSADIAITGPGGYYDTDFLWDDEGWNKLSFCDSPNMAGTYTVTAEIKIDHYSDYSGYTTTYETVTTTFQVQGPVASAVTYAKRTYGAHGWKFPVKATSAGRPWANKNVTMQMKICGSWRKVLTKTTGSTGRVTFFSTPKKGFNSGSACGVRYPRLPLRFYVAGNYKTKAAYSSVFRISRR
jgi:hypothetical protein